MSIVEKALAKAKASAPRPGAGGSEAATRPSGATARPRPVAPVPPARSVHDRDPHRGDDFAQRLGQQLLDERHLSDLDLARAMRVYRESPMERSLPGLLVSLGIVAEAPMARTLAELLETPLAGPADYPAAAVADASSLSVRFLKEHKIVPLGGDSRGLTLAMADPTDDYARRAVAVACEKPVIAWTGIPSEIDAAIERIYGESAPQSVDVSEVDERVDDADVEQLRDMASGAPVIRLVNNVMQRAAEAGASDVHIEPFEGRLKVRLRIDGVLQETDAPPRKLAAAVISRIKIMAKLNIAERRLPQDGRIKARIQGKDLDIRVSTVPTMYGESVVMRLLNRDDVVLDLRALGFSDTVRERFIETLKLPHGLILVTGPTGSGKTTTLYTALNILNTEARKIITAEDPVEYQLDGVNQIQVKPSIDLTFANALRSIVRQDPDVIMVGEMRDRETAEMCVQSALTGHLVLSTLHTNDAAGSITRLLEMGIEDYLLSSTLKTVIGQRLVRLLCRHCREAYRPPAELIKELALEPRTDGGELLLHRAKGCPSCNGGGYRGRLAILEMLVVDDQISSLIMQHADARQIHAMAVSHGMRTMLDDGISKVLEGLTSLEEVMRIIRED